MYMRARVTKITPLRRRSVRVGKRRFVLPMFTLKPKEKGEKKFPGLARSGRGLSRIREFLTLASDPRKWLRVRSLTVSPRATSVTRTSNQSPMQRMARFVIARGERARRYFARVTSLTLFRARKRRVFADVRQRPRSLRLPVVRRGYLLNCDAS